MATLTADKSVDMFSITSLLSTLNPIPTTATTAKLVFDSSAPDFDLVLFGTFDLAAKKGTIATFEIDFPSGTFAYKFEGLSISISLSAPIPDIASALGGDDSLNGSSFKDAIRGFGGNDTIAGFGGIDYLFGDDGNDSIYGGTENDVLNGGAGNDILKGDAGTDILTGAVGRDLLVGGTERDIFDFNSIKDSVRGANRDQILDFQHGTNITGDDIDLRTIDAKTHVAGNNAFKWIGKQGFHDVKGELRYIDKGASCIAQGDVNGDGKADFEIFVKVGSLAKGDFLL